MTEYKLVPVSGGDALTVSIPSSLVVFKNTDAPELTKNPIRCQALLDALSKHGVSRSRDGSVIIGKKLYPNINYDEVIYYLVDGGKRRDPAGLNTVLDAIKFFEIPKQLLAKKFHKLL